ncbi:MAG: carbohydrate binding family 9 domain-containing protein [Ekhidna sp.]|nr:carbohydrate binding family 9 domain-containing protein [Ekhidna sp.]
MPRVLFICFYCVSLILAAQSESIEIRRANGQIQIDGDPTDGSWTLADSAFNFTQNFPTDSLLAKAQTVAKILYDDDNIYVLGVMYNLPDTRKYVTPSLRRDFRGAANDSFSVVLDPFSDRTNAFLFGVNPFGVMREALITNGGTGVGSFSLDWDNKWYAKAKQFDDYWVVEMAIPFKTLRFNEGADSWLVNFYRVDSEYAERSTWSPIKRTFPIFNLATTKKLNWDTPTKKPGTNVSVIPYIATNSQRDFEENTGDDFSPAAGFDLKYAVTPGLNLDVTVNPDFSQVEVDQQVTNLDRFEIFFPERRQFFLENADLFSSFGTRTTRPFFSRRIGIAIDTLTGQNVQNQIPVGARLSGKLSDDLRIGVLSMQAAGDDAIGLPSYNYSMVSLQQKVFSRSNVNFFAVNKQTFESKSEFDTTSLNAYNRTFGFEYRLASKNNAWNGKAFYHRTAGPQNMDDPFAAGVILNYDIQKWSVDVFSQMVGTGFNPEVGFVRRNDIRQLATTIQYLWFPARGGIQSHGPAFDFDMLGNDEFGFLDWDYNLQYVIDFRNTSNFFMRLRRQYTYLFDSFDPSGTGGVELAADTDYTNFQIIARYESDQRKKFFYELNTRSGQYFNGDRINLQGSIGYRYQPLGFTSIDFAYNSIILPAPYTTTSLYLIGPRFDFTFSRNIFWTTFVQYNSQIENLNINTRFQWRFKPVSDIFLVYTDNYFADHEGGFMIGQPRTRALTFKVTYWLNL